MNQDWKNNPQLNGIDPKKMNMLLELLTQAQGKKTEELIPFFLASTQKANSMGVSFDENETDLILNVLKANMSEEERQRVDTVRKLARQIASRNMNNR